MQPARQSPRHAHTSVLVLPFAAGKLSLRASRIIFGLTTVSLLLFCFGCNTYNPYLGATPTVSSSITSISPSGASATTNHPDVLLTVTGSGFVAGSNVTWSNSGSAATNLVSNFVSGSEMQANIPGTFLGSPGTFFVGVIAPGPTSGNNAGNNISNFVPFTVFSSSSSAVSTPTPQISTASENASTRLFARIHAGPRYQAIVADSTNPAFETGTNPAGIFLRDTCFGAAPGCSPRIIPVSVGWDESEPNGASNSPSVTANGRFVVFASEANNLVKRDSNGWSDIFLRDTCIGAASTCIASTVRLSVAPDGAEANGASFAPAISPDGRFVVFNSSATNLVPPDPNAPSVDANASLFLRDTCFGAASPCVPATSRVIPASSSRR